MLFRKRPHFISLSKVGKKKDPNRWTKGEYVGIIEDTPDDLGWSKAPPAKTQNWVDTTGSPSDWGAEGTSWEPGNEERVIVDKTDQDSWPTVGDKRKENAEEVVSGNNDSHNAKENWNTDISTFGDSLDAVIDVMEAAEEAAGSWDSAKWSGSEGSPKDSNTESSCSSVDAKKDLDTKGNSQQTWSKTPGKSVKLKGGTTNKTENNSDSLSDSLVEVNPGWKEMDNSEEKWKTVGKSSNKGTKNDPSPVPSEETGWGESSVGNRNSGGNWNASWSSQGLSLTGTEIWDQGSSEEKMNTNNDKGCDWLENSEECKNVDDSGWEEVGEEEGGDDGWNRWTTASSKRIKVGLLHRSGIKLH